MPRKGLKYVTVYMSEGDKAGLLVEAVRAGKSLSKFISEKLGLSVVGSEDKPSKEKPEKPREEAKIPAYVGERVVNGVYRGPPRALTTKEKQAWHKKQSRKY